MEALAPVESETPMFQLPLGVTRVRTIVLESFLVKRISSTCYIEAHGIWEQSRQNRVALKV